MKKIAVLTGAGVSAESGIKTFRDADGLWEGHDVMQVATPEGWDADQQMVLEFYNERRQQLLDVQPNAAHRALVKLESQFSVVIITQNIDDLHERAGSTNVVHLHGELLKARSTVNPTMIYEWSSDMKLGDTCELGSQLRPHVVWFGEAVPMMERATIETSDAHVVIVIGTSMLVYPAAGLVHYAPADASIYYIDPKPNLNIELARRPNLEVISKTAGDGVPALVERLLGK